MWRARLAVSTIFFVNGAVLASWVPHIPAVKARHGANDAQLGFVLLTMAAGALFALPLAGRLIGRFGSRAVTSVAALAFCVAMPLPVLSPTLGLVAAALGVLGACNGVLDVAMNAQAAAVEHGLGRAAMSSFHSLFSLGGLGGALLASGAMLRGLDDVQHVLAAAALALVVVSVTRRWLLPSPRAAPAPGPALAWPAVSLLVLGGLAFLGLLAEGAMADWSAVYLRDVVGASPALAAVGFAGFSLAMAAGRLIGDPLVDRVGARAVVRVSGAVAAAGLTVALLVGGAAAGILGMALVGLGIANVIPVVFAASTRTPGIAPGRALAAVATTGYLGFLVGPAAIGGIAEVAGLPAGLALVSVACALIAVRGLPAR